MTPFAMLYTVAVGVPIACAALALAAVLRRYGRAERWVWLGGLVLACAVPAISLMIPNSASRPITTTSSGAELGVIGLPEFIAVPAGDPNLDWSGVLLVAWLAASLALALGWAVAAYRLSRASRAWTRSTIDGVAVSLTHDVGPAVVGTFRPRVLAPSWLGAMPARERALILMHEEEHIRARDPLLITCTRIARVVLPWNPVVWFLSSRLVRAVELDCDRRVLSRTSDVAAYGHTLLTVSRRRPGRLVAVAAFAESEAPLRNRILSMTTPPRSVSLGALAVSIALGVALFVGACEVPVPTEVPDAPVAPAPDQTPSVTALDAPPTPPAPAEPTTTIEQRADASEPVPSPRVGLPAAPAVAPAPTPPPAAPAPSIARGEPAFTPMTVRPALTNAQDLMGVLVAEYPPLLRDAGIGGAPILWIHIATDGGVDDTRVFQSSGYEALDEAARRVASAMRFSPARNGDAVVDAWVQIPIRFAAVN